LQGSSGGGGGGGAGTVTSTVVHGEVSGFPLQLCFFFTTWHPPGCCEVAVGAICAETCAALTATKSKQHLAARTMVKNNLETGLGNVNPGAR